MQARFTLLSKKKMGGLVKVMIGFILMVKLAHLSKEPEQKIISVILGVFVSLRGHFMV